MKKKALSGRGLLEFNHEESTNHFVRAFAGPSHRSSEAKTSRDQKSASGKLIRSVDVLPPNRRLKSGPIRRNSLVRHADSRQVRSFLIIGAALLSFGIGSSCVFLTLRNCTDRVYQLL